MKNNIVRITIGTLLLTQGVAIDARTISTPPILYQGYEAGHVHYPLDLDREVDNCSGISFKAWGAGYRRSANNAYGPSTSTSNDCESSSNCTPSPSGSSKISIAQLIFGSDSFTLAQSFAGSAVGTSIPNNPFVTASHLSPVYEINENGIFFGGMFDKEFERCGGTWHVGLRVALPYRDIDVDNQCSDLVGETLGDLFRTRQEASDEDTGEFAAVTSEWTARLDFLSALNTFAFDVAGNLVPLVIYSDPNAAGQITVGGQALPNGLPAGSPPVDNTPDSQPYIDAIRTADGSVPESVRWGQLASLGATVINADGTGLLNLQRGRFASDINYTPLGANISQEAQLWLVPNLASDNTLSSASNAVLAAIQAASSDIQPSITPFLTANGIDFCSGRSKGVGDLDLEWYLGHQRCDYGWGELQFGVRVPTGKKLTDARLLAKQPLGNNGHVELRPGLVLGCEYWDWVKFKLDVTYSFVLKKTELLPAPFTGATVSNIGPNLPGNVSWQYFLGDFDITLVNPQNPCLGVTLAYQPYVKLADKICFNCTTALDFLGNPQTINSAILTANTKRIAHTIRTEIFFDSPCCNIYAGFAQVVAGQNITRDTDIYIGLQADF